jgi:Bacterial SH3 domain
MGDKSTREEGQGRDASRRGGKPRAKSALSVGRPFANNRMSETNLDRTRCGLVVRGRAFLGLAVLGLLAVGLFAAGCTRSLGDSPASQANRDATLRRIASEYVQDQDLARAQASLGKLGLANPGQLLVTMAEEDINQGRSREEVEPLALLAERLGARSPVLVAYLRPEPTATPVPASPTPQPPSPTAAPTSTLVPSTQPSPVPSAASTVTPTATPQPRVVAEDTANLRSGPGKAYPLVGRLNAGESAEIIARNASGDWWQLARKGAGSAWVSGTTVKVQGPIDTVAVAKNVPPPPPPPTAGPPTAPPPTQTPPAPAGPDFRLVSKRLFSVEENGGRLDGPTVVCGFNHTLYVTVLDAAGNPLSGVTIKDANGPTEKVSGDKGPGKLDFDLWWPGIDVVVVRDADGHQVTSDVARGIMVDPGAIPDDVLISARYCTDAGSCAAFRAVCGCCHHHSWEATFQRAY